MSYDITKTQARAHVFAPFTNATFDATFVALYCTFGAISARHQCTFSAKSFKFTSRFKHVRKHYNILLSCDSAKTAFNKATVLRQHIRPEASLT